MIFSVGGRTDIVNYYTPWFLKRLKEGYVYTRNPFNKRSVTKYSLKREDVDAIIFTSKNYEPILKDMDFINSNYPIFCYYTITSYGDDVEVNVPSVEYSLDVISELSDIVGSQKVAWRFDPILVTDKYDIDLHLERFEYICSRISKKISFCVFSFVDMYDKVYRNMPEIVELGCDDKEQIILSLVKIAEKYGVRLQSCAVNDEYVKYGVGKSGCVTSEILERSNDILFKDVKIQASREGCCCIDWRDIGEYNTCINGCKYCYATRDHKLAKDKYLSHDPDSPILIGKISDSDKINVAQQKSFLLRDYMQQTLF